MKKGERKEANLSTFYHQKYPALLVCPDVLRKMDCGQIDIAYYDKQNKKMILIESKSSARLSKKQHQRLLRTQDYLSQLFEISVFLQVNFCKNGNHSLCF